MDQAQMAYADPAATVRLPTSENSMPGPARTGVLIYAKNLLAVSAFYEKVLGAKVLHADNEHRVLPSPDVQLIIHATSEQHSSSLAIQVPPVAREEQAIKPFFTVESLWLQQNELLSSVEAGSGVPFRPAQESKCAMFATRRATSCICAGVQPKPSPEPTFTGMALAAQLKPKRSHISDTRELAEKTPFGQKLNAWRRRRAKV